jgi:hypothetical protein
VSKAETVARLQKLLERVRSRAGTRDGYRADATAPAMSTTVDSGPVEEPVQLSTWTPPPPDEPAPEVGIPVDVDYVETAQVAVADGGAEEDAAGHFDSTERLVVADATVAYAGADEGGENLEPSPLEPDGGVQAAQETQSAADNVGEEAVEPAPASSRRPVMPEAEERLARMAFGVEEAPPPLHTPPPESGRVPASPADDFDSDPLDAPRQVRHPDEPLIAETTRALLESSVPVAKLMGGPRRPAPMTFSAILDETLSL